MECLLFCVVGLIIAGYGLVNWLLTVGRELDAARRTAERLTALERELQLLQERMQELSAGAVSSDLPVSAGTSAIGEKGAPAAAARGQLPEAPLAEYDLPEFLMRATSPEADPAEPARSFSVRPPDVPEEAPLGVPVGQAVHPARTVDEPVMVETGIGAGSASASEPARWNTLEERIGGQWLGWLAAITVVFTVGLFLKWAYDRGWITPLFHLPPMAYLSMGWAAGGLFLGWSEWLRRRLPLYAQGLAGTAVAVLYLTTYAGGGLYRVLSPQAATLGLAAVGLLAIALSVRHDSPVIGWTGVVLAYVSPLLLGGSGSGPAFLFLYLTLLNGAVLGISVLREWPGFRLGSFLATVLLYLAWHMRRYTPLLLTPAVLFVAVNAAIFLGVLALHPLLWRRRTRDTDLAVAVMNPLLAGTMLYVLLQPRFDDRLGAVSLGIAALYWLLSAGLRRRVPEGERPDWMEQLFFATALVHVVLAVPLQLNGPAVTASWSLLGAALSAVGMQTLSPRTRAWGRVALGLGTGRLLLMDAWLRGPVGREFFEGRGFSFAAVVVSLLVLAAVEEREWRLTGGDRSRAGWMVGTTLFLGGVMGLWTALDLPPPWVAPAWAAAAGMVLAFGWHRRSRPLREASLWAAAPALVMGLIPAFAEALLNSWASAPRQGSLDSFLETAPGYMACLVLCTAGAWTAACSRRFEPEEAAAAVPVWGSGAAAAAMAWSAAELGPGWLPAAWLGVAMALLAAGVLLERSSLRVLAVVVAAALSAETIASELDLPQVHAPLLHSRTAAALACLGAWTTCTWVARRRGNEGETAWLPALVVGTNLQALGWLSIEAMDLAGRIGPAQWGAEAAQFALSAVWIIYALGAIGIGFRRHVPAARFGGIALLLAAVAKVYLFDLGALALGYRVLSFLALALVLLVVSYLYHRQRDPGEGAPEAKTAGTR